MLNNDLYLIMKKTLFLALAFGFAGLSQATVVESTVTVASPADLPVTGALSIGTANAPGSVTVNSGVSLTLPGALFIGGIGSYSGVSGTTGNDGDMTLNSGAVLTVGAEDTTGTAAQSHINVGNSKDANVTGQLTIDGATVKAEQVVVGQENGGVGHIVISGDGAMTLLHTQGELNEFHGLLIRNGDVTVKDTAAINNTVSDTFVGTESTASLNIQDSATASFWSVSVGAANGSTTSAVSVSGGAAVTVLSDLIVSENASVSVSGTGSTLDSDTIWVDNSEVNVTDGAETTAAYVELAGSNAVVNVEGETTAVKTDVLVLNAGTNVYLSGSSASSIQNLQAAETYFTITADNYATGQIHKDNNEKTDVGHAIVEMDGSLLNSLVAGNRTITLVETPDKTNNSDYTDVTWRTDGDISYTVEQDDTKFGGLVLQLDKTDATHTDPDALANEIIDSLVSPTSVAAINTLNGTVAALGGLFNVVKTQLQMPHNVDLPVGNVAEDSRLAYTGRYFVGANRAWVSALGTADRVATDGRGQGYHYNGGGYAVGYDRVITPQMYVGAAVGQMIGKYKSNNELVRDSQKTYEGSLYAHYTHEMKKSDNRFNVDAFIGGGRARNRARGTMAVGSADPATARWNDTSFGCGLRLSYDIVLSDADIVTPFIGIEGIYAWQDKYTMTNGTTSLNYHDGKASVWTLPVGATYRHIIAISKTEYVIPQMTVAYLGDISRKDPSVKYDWTSGTGSVYGAGIGRHGVQFEVGASWVLSSEWCTGAFYNLENREGDCYQEVKGFVSYSF